MNSIFKKKTIFEVDYWDFQKFVESIYGEGYDFVAIQEGNNDSQYSFTVGVKTITGSYFETDKQKIKNGEYPMYSNGTLFQLLYDEGHIEAGEYIVSVCW